jgi:hypothetical protein
MINQTTDTLLLHQSNKLITSFHTVLRGFRQILLRLFPFSIPELLVQLDEVSTPALLNTTANRIQYQLWKLPNKEQALIRKRMIATLSVHTLEGSTASLRLEAASWLRLLLQAGLVAKPEEAFVTLVTATVRERADENITTTLIERKALLSLMFQCFWPFHFPYPAYSWEEFPANKIFYPLAPLLEQADYEMQDALIGIFAELPRLDDEQIREYLLPVVLQWSEHQDPERRRRVPNILARIDQDSAREALNRLQADTDRLVRENAKNAAGYARNA